MELGVRVGLYEHEANRNYWGRHAFIPDAEAVYRQAPSTTSLHGRWGALPPASLTTNALGYRDHRLLNEAADVPRVMVLGMSKAFGVGLAQDEDLFHRQLEQFLRTRADVPDDVQVFNVSQTGYRTRELRSLLAREIGVLDPQLVVAFVPYGKWESFYGQGKEVDIVNGYRLPRGRPSAGGVLDDLRTLSWAWMRMTTSSLLSIREYVDGQLLTRLTAEQADPVDATSVRSGGGQKVLNNIRSMKRLSENQGAAFVCVVQIPEDWDGWITRALRGEVKVVEIAVDSEWMFSADGHWNATGHREIARILAAQLPVQSLN